MLIKLGGDRVFYNKTKLFITAGDKLSFHRFQVAPSFSGFVGVFRHVHMSLVEIKTDICTQEPIYRS